MRGIVHVGVLSGALDHDNLRVGEARVGYAMQHDAFGPLGMAEKSDANTNSNDRSTTKTPRCSFQIYHDELMMVNL